VVACRRRRGPRPDAHPQARADVLEDTRMYWLFGVRHGKLSRVASSPDLAGLLRDAGHADPVLAREAFIALHRDAGLEVEPER
jgi:hypothetical protein